MTLEAVQFNLRACVENVVSMLRGPADQKGLDFVLHIPTRCPEVVHGDESRLTQVLTKCGLLV